MFFYATGKEKAVVGVMEVSADPAPDPADDDRQVRRGDGEAGAEAETPVTLAAIKADKAFAKWELVKQARLSVMPVPDELWTKIEKMA